MSTGLAPLAAIRCGTSPERDVALHTRRVVFRAAFGSRARACGETVGPGFGRDRGRGAHAEIPRAQSVARWILSRCSISQVHDCFCVGVVVGVDSCTAVRFSKKKVVRATTAPGCRARDIFTRPHATAGSPGGMAGPGEGEVAAQCGWTLWAERGHQRKAGTDTREKHACTARDDVPRPLQLWLRCADRRVGGWAAGLRIGRHRTSEPSPGVLKGCPGEGTGGCVCCCVACVCCVLLVLMMMLSW